MLGATPLPAGGPYDLAKTAAMRDQPGRHRLRVFRDYGHLDVFVGRDAARDTFPTILGLLAGDDDVR